MYNPLSRLPPHIQRGVPLDINPYLLRHEEENLLYWQDQITRMSDQELIRFGRAAKSLSEMRKEEPPHVFRRQHEMAREEWKRRNPKT
jgi:hypothetical protein